MFGYPCPFCEQRLLAAPERAGQRTICPKCLKPIVIPKPEPEAQAETSQIVPEVEPDEVPISMMPAGLDDEPVPLESVNKTPGPEPRPAARIGPPAGTPADPIPLQPAAAMLVRNPDSVTDFEPIPLRNAVEDQPLPASSPGQASLPLPMPSYPEPTFPQPTYSAPKVQAPKPPAPKPQAPKPQAPQIQVPKFAAPAPVFPSPGRITGDHPAATMPESNQNSNQTGGLIVFNPTDVEAANIAAQLTTVISMTMKPAPEPPSDLRLTTGLWIILTACGGALWLFCMISDPEPLKYVAVIGALELLIGYLWVAVAYGQRNLRNGFTTLFPPLWVYRAANPPYEPGYRPLRFVVAGAILLSMYVIAPKVQPSIYAWIGIPDDTVIQVPEIPETPLMKLLAAESDGDTYSVKRQLALFAKPESIILTPADEKPAVVANLNRIVKKGRPELRDEAIRALAIWSREDAKPVILAALDDSNDDIRETAYELIVAWNDRETVQRLVNQLGNSNLARPALETIGRSEPGRAAIEEAILPLIQSNQIDRRNVLIALASEFGGAKLLPILEEQMAKLAVQSERETLRICISKIRSRLKN